MEAVADEGERWNGASLRKNVAPCVVRPTRDDVVRRIGVPPHRALDVGERIVGLTADFHCKKVVDALAPNIGAPHVAVLVDVRKALPAVVVDVANRAFLGRRGDAPPQGVVGVALSERAVGRDRHELVLAVPRQVERGPTVALDARHASRRIVGVRAAVGGQRAVRPTIRGEPVADAEGVCRRLAVLRARHAVAGRVVCVGHAAVRGKAVDGIVGVCFVRRLGQLGRLGRIAESVVARDDAPRRVVGVGEAAESRAVRRRPRDVRHAVHDVVGVGRDKAVGVRDRGKFPVPRAVAEAERPGGRVDARPAACLVQRVARRARHGHQARHLAAITVCVGDRHAVRAA